MISNEQLLADYSREIGVSTNLQQLIDSHRYLRNSRIAFDKEIDELRKSIADATRKSVRLEVENGEYIAVSKLKEMTMKELVEFLRED